MKTARSVPETAVPLLVHTVETGKSGRDENVEGLVALLFYQRLPCVRHRRSHRPRGEGGVGREGERERRRRKGRRGGRGRMERREEGEGGRGAPKRLFFVRRASVMLFARLLWRRKGYTDGRRKKRSVWKWR